jgi:hypothetical protein
MFHYNQWLGSSILIISQTITGDLGGKAKTAEYAAAVIKAL